MGAGLEREARRDKGPVTVEGQEMRRLVTRVEEEVSSCGLLSIGSRSWVCWSESPAPAGAEE